MYLPPLRQDHLFAELLVPPPSPNFAGAPPTHPSAAAGPLVRQATGAAPWHTLYQCARLYAPAAHQVVGRLPACAATGARCEAAAELPHGGAHGDEEADRRRHEHHQGAGKGRGGQPGRAEAAARSVLQPAYQRQDGRAGAAVAGGWGLGIWGWIWGGWVGLGLGLGLGFGHWVAGRLAPPGVPTASPYVYTLHAHTPHIHTPYTAPLGRGVDVRTHTSRFIRNSHVHALAAHTSARVRRVRSSTGFTTLASSFHPPL
eukprot:31911-Chlamydomonas_euryale.AAC.1